MSEPDGLRIGSFAGAAIIIQPAFLLLAAYVVGSELLRGGPAALAGALIFVAAIFAAVLIHEIGHAAMALALRIPSKRIVLTFFGGYVQFARQPQRRWHEIAVSAAGPGANLVSYLLIAGILPASTAAFTPGDAASEVLNALQMFAYLSLLLGAFNLLPGFPLDGGHILRAALSYVMPAYRARMGAAIAGLLLAAGLVAFAVWQELLWTVFIAALLGLAAWAEFKAARAASAAQRSSDETSNA
jgi:Zn-dependent protease